MRLWCEQAWLGGPQPAAGVLVEIDGDRISAVTHGVPAPPPAAERLDGFVLPGLVNAHSHAFHRALRGRTQGERGSFWTWRDQMYRLAGRLTPDTYFPLAAATFAEMALAGITTVGEFHYLHHGPGGVPYDEPNTMGEVLIEAARVAGVRLTLLDTCYLHGGIGREPDEVQRRFSDGNVDGWVTRVSGLAGADLLRVGAAIHSVRAVDFVSMAVVASWARRHDAVLHAHVSEQPAENDACVEAFGATPTGLLSRTGVLGPRFSAVHATHVGADDIAMLGSAECGVCLCPTTERDLADGVGPAGALAAAGAQLSLGSDSHAVVDLFEEARAVELDERLASGERGHHGAEELLRAATQGGARSLGWPDTGALEPGMLADLVAVGTRGVRLAGTPPEHLLSGTVFAATAADVRDVMVAGRWVVRGGRHQVLDVAGALTASIEGAWA
jgi:formiminoglutamate deiminase